MVIDTFQKIMQRPNAHRVAAISKIAFIRDNSTAPRVGMSNWLPQLSAAPEFAHSFLSIENPELSAVNRVGVARFPFPWRIQCIDLSRDSPPLRLRWRWR
jgi:hypothetical protein